MFNPKLTFQAQTEIARAFGNFINSDTMDIALAYATAEYFTSNNVTDAQAKAVHDFIRVMQTLANKEQPSQKGFPAKVLSYSASKPSK